MADATVTATSVVKGAGAEVERGYAGETITAGQTLYQDTTDGLLYKADNNVNVMKATLKGIALNGGAVGQPIVFQKSGKITPGATLVKGGIYALSATAGGFCPVADLASGSYVSILGVADSTTSLTIGINNTGILIP